MLRSGDETATMERRRDGVERDETGTGTGEVGRSEDGSSGRVVL